MNEDPLSVSAPSVLSFSYQNYPLRVEQDTDGEPLFHANDLCALLEYSNPWDAIKRHADEEDLVKREALTAGGMQQVNYLREPGMWSLILGSHAPGAKPIKRWVTSEVLPAIRKTGQYAMPGSQPTLTDRLRSSRFLLSFDTDDAIRLQEVPARAVLVNPETLADLIGDSGSVFSRSLLPRIIGAAAERLAGLHPAARPHSINSTWPIEPPSIYDQVLMRVTAAKGQGLAVRELISGCWAFRNLTSADRAKLINQMLQDQVLVEIGTTNKTGPRGKRLVAAGKGYQ